MHSSTKKSVAGWRSTSTNSLVMLLQELFFCQLLLFFMWITSKFILIFGIVWKHFWTKVKNKLKSLCQNALCFAITFKLFINDYLLIELNFSTQGLFSYYSKSLSRSERLVSKYLFVLFIFWRYFSFYLFLFLNFFSYLSMTL